MNIKKIGLTALAGSLVAVSAANAGALSVTGGASINISGFSGSGNVDKPTTFSMGDQFTVSGGGELDNGMNVSISMQIDAGALDDHSVTVSSEGMGTLVFAGHAGNSATDAIDGSVAGDIFDGFDGAAAVAVGTTGAAPKTAAAGNNSLFYTAPEMMEGVSIFASYNPQTHDGNEGEVGFGATYTGIEGLSLSYATTDVNSGSSTTSGDQTSWKATYAYGPITVGASKSEHDTSTDTSDTELTAYSIAYTVSDELSVSYGVEELSVGGSGNPEDAEYSALVVAYTAGGLTLTAKAEDAENVDNTTAVNADQEFWGLTAAFAF
jgi:outer membrane protein OmpU